MAVILQLNLKLKYGEDITLKFYVYTYILIKTQNLICHHLIDVHLYKFFTCLDINKTCLNQNLMTISH